MRVTATIVILLALGGCGGSSEPGPGSGPGPAVSVPASQAPRCEPWPDGQLPSSGARLAQSAEQSLPGTTDSGLGSPVTVVVGNACVVLPARDHVVGLYCGAAEDVGAPLPCLVGEECAIGSIMVTDVARFEQADGVATCATFENWSRTAPRSIVLWAKTR